MSKRKLQERMTLFNAGDWAHFMKATASRRQEEKWQCGNVNTQRTIFLGEPRRTVG